MAQMIEAKKDAAGRQPPPLRFSVLKGENVVTGLTVGAAAVIVWPLMRGTIIGD